jgi:5-methylcytosine-specific restriction endonuclease McrA
MSESIPASLARLVVARANETCEYCKLPQWSQEATFHIDHIQPRADGGETIEANLALACVSCSLKKAARILALDPKTKKMVQLFHPREDGWSDHFRWTQAWRLVGKTAIARATIDALGMNRPAIVRIRGIWAALGEFDPNC